MPNITSKHSIPYKDFRPLGLTGDLTPLTLYTCRVIVKVQVDRSDFLKLLANPAGNLYNCGVKLKVEIASDLKPLSVRRRISRFLRKSP